MTVRHLAVPAYTVPAGGGGGVLDFSGYANTSAVAGFTTHDGGNLGISSGVLRVFNGASPSDGYYARSVYDTADGDNVHIVEVEASFGSTGDELALYYCSNVGWSSFLGLTVKGDGTYLGEYESGGAGGSGSWTFPGVGVHFNIKAESTGSGGYVWTLNGGTPVSGSQPTRTGTYAALRINGSSRIYKWAFPSGI